MASGPSAAGRPLDHLVLPTADVAVAMRRLQALGFTVAPMGVHPFGTTNHCVYFGNDTFLEAISVPPENQQKYDEAAAQGNQFIKRDQVYRFRNGQEGFSALVFGTSDAKQDHDTFEHHGISAGRNLEFSRSFVTKSGEKDQASFELAFAADLRAPDVFFFNCQRVVVPRVDRSALELLRTHANGVTAIREVVAWAPDATPYLSLMATLTNSEAGQPSNASISICDAKQLNERYGVVPKFLQENSDTKERGLRLCGIVFDVASWSPVMNLCESPSIDFSIAGEDSMLVVPETTGQGAFFAFKQAGDES